VDGLEAGKNATATTAKCITGVASQHVAQQILFSSLQSTLFGIEFARKNVS
jgi:hypothetical protein